MTLMIVCDSARHRLTQFHLRAHLPDLGIVLLQKGCDGFHLLSDRRFYVRNGLFLFLKLAMRYEELVEQHRVHYQRNTVTFHPNALCESAFTLPLTPFDVDVVRNLTQINQRLETHSQS
jgi:hypothetical protein